MTGKTSIEWATDTWNPLTGCTKVSPGCDHCYAIPMSRRVEAMQAAQPFREGTLAYAGTTKHEYDATGQLMPVDWSGKINLLPDRLGDPLRATKPRRYFVNSMSDLFHDGVPDDYIAQVFGVMGAATHHMFMVLTKRHARMRSLLNRDDFWAEVHQRRAGHVTGRGPEPAYTGAHSDQPHEFPNVMLGVSVENQQWANIRVPHLIDTPAAARFLSCEPLLGPVNLAAPGRYALRNIDWVIVGGESGPGARPMPAAWAQSLRDQCEMAGVPFLFKQWGAWTSQINDDQRTAALQAPTVYVNDETGETGSEETAMVGGTWSLCYQLGKKASGRRLDGVTHDGFPTMRGAHA